MRFIHTGDIHLGAAPESGKAWAKDRGAELWSTFEKLIKKIKDDPVDMLFIAGDLFHRQPLLRELKEVDYLFSTIPGTKVILCAGNHDAIKKGSFYKDFAWSDNVIFLGNEDVQKVEIAELGVCVYGMSYHESEITRSVYDNIVPDNPAMINILLAHGGDEKHIPINRRRLAMSGFDYVAMGHIHIPEIDEKNRMAYCGSLEPIDSGDVGARGYIYGEVDKRSLELCMVPFASRIYINLEYTVSPDDTAMSIRHVVGDLMRENGENNMYRVVLDGYRDPDLDIYSLDLDSVGNVAKITDNTVPDYDFEALYMDNRDNILGMFIEKFLDKKDDITPREKKSLYYGTKALLDSMEDRL